MTALARSRTNTQITINNSITDQAVEALGLHSCSSIYQRFRLSQHPVSDEVGAALGAFVAGGVGPRHAVLTRVFTRTGYGNSAPYNSNSADLQPNKEDRVRLTVSAAVRDPHRARELIDGLLSEYTAFGFFHPDQGGADEVARKERVRATQAAFARIDWELSDDGELRPMGLGAVVSVEGRPAIEDQLRRLRRANDDPALLLGTAKEMLESTAKYVLEEFAVPYAPSMGFDELWFHARDRLGLLPQQVDNSASGAAQVREILQSSWSIARMTNELRGTDGTGHGRALPTAVSAQMALLVVREACSVGELVLATLDRHLRR